MPFTTMLQSELSQLELYRSSLDRAGADTEAGPEAESLAESATVASPKDGNSSNGGDTSPR